MADTKRQFGDTAPSPPEGGGARTTVLPRMSWEGPAPQVVRDRRERYEELSRLGRGGMGEVVLLKDHDIQRTVALKRLPENSDLEGVIRFAEEIRTVGALEHPNIVPLHDVGVDEQGRYFFLMKHLEGETLEAMIRKLGAGDREAHARYPFPARVQLFLGVLNAMAYAHRSGVIHRDLKPANIMLGPFGEVTVMDWGIAKRIRHAPGAPVRKELRPVCAPADADPLRDTAPPSVTRTTGTLIGTPLYMSPEQVAGAELDERTDVYSLGVLFHELLYLDHYLKGRTAIADILDGVRSFTPEVFPLTPHPAQSTVPAELGWFVLKALEKDPSRRYASVDEMAAELQRVLDGRFAIRCQRTAMKRALHAVLHVIDRHPVLVIVGSTAVGALILAAIVRAAQAALGP